MTKLYSRSEKLCSACSGNIHPIWLTLPLIGWEQSSPVEEEEIKIQMDDGVARFFTCFGGNLLTCGRHSLVSGTQNEIVVSWITLWGMIKVYWLVLSLAYIFDHAVCCASATSSGWSLHLITSQLRMKSSSSNCPNHVQRTKSSVKKWIIVHQIVWSMCAEQTFARLRTGFTEIFWLH